jgi:agmatine deiminase
VIWLPFGLALDHDTDGHVDNVAACAPNGRLLVQGCADKREEDFARLAINRKVAECAMTASGKPFDVVEVPILPFVTTTSGRVVVPYLNYYVGNQFVLVPTCGHSADAEMLAIIEDSYPGRNVVGLPVGEILAVGGGGIHCITQQMPLLAS